VTNPRCKTLGGVRLAFENLVTTVQEILLVLYSFYQIGIDSGNFAMSATLALSPAITADLNLFQNAENSFCAKASDRRTTLELPPPKT